MKIDRSGGWEAISEKFMAARSNIGVALVRQWAGHLPPAGDVVDIGCGAGVPISEALANQGLNVFGIDASPTLISAFRRHFPNAQAACEAVEDSRFFGRKFDAAIAVGLIFLLSPKAQRKTIKRVGSALKPGGRFLFSAPRQECEWNDLLTGQLSVSLGMEQYRQILDRAGMTIIDSHVDEGENHYIDAVRTFTVPAQ